ncbi:CIC11C00000000123 [Sungouiella intermedia]|uniref:CIC11C00000000123 n=1 Tax=Sungouiella intermedia TaxID=45354 RepID=A0A1L0BX04_9ASCO|nr:CIC11C00000000123 [[Candida] intermedia]
MSLVQLRSSSPAKQLASTMTLDADAQIPIRVPLHYNPPLHEPTRRNTDLRILVPDSDLESLSGLADAIVMQPSSLSSLITSVDYEKITQLPTPVLTNGLFKNYQLDIQKRAPATKGSGVHPLNGPFPAPTRVLSEFDPGRTFTSPTEMTHTVGKVRHISNPQLLPRRATEIPLPPLDVDISFKDQEFHAPRLGVSYVFDDVIGSGAFSTVVSAHSTTVTAPQIAEVAIKIITVPTNDVSSVSNFRLYICRELAILLHLHHPSIVQLLDYDISLSISSREIEELFRDASQATPPGADMYDLYNMKMSNKQYFFLSYCPGGNLLQWLLRNHKLASGTVQFWKLMERIVAELVVAIGFLHANMVVHRDIKLENILLSETFADVSTNAVNSQFSALASLTSSLSVLTDFGLSKKLELPTQLLSTKCGSQDYVSPELFMGIKYDGKLLDSWSLGVVIYSILEDRLPFDAPPLEYANTQGVSPSVLKRRRSRNTPAHRIAMIDWDWYRVPAVMKDESLPQEAKDIMTRLMDLVEVFLVRKDKRKLVSQVLEDDRFVWVKDMLPESFLRAK